MKRVCMVSLVIHGKGRDFSEVHIKGFWWKVLFLEVKVTCFPECQRDHLIDYYLWL